MPRGNVGRTLSFKHWVKCCGLTQGEENMTKRLLAVAALVLLATGAMAGVTGASSQGSKASSVSQGKLGIRNGVIYGCVETHGSKQTLGDLKLANCHKGFKAVAWNIRGPKGAKRRTRGAAGPRGRRVLRGRKARRGPPARRATKATRATLGLLDSAFLAWS